ELGPPAAELHEASDGVGARIPAAVRLAVPDLPAAEPMQLVRRNAGGGVAVERVGEHGKAAGRPDGLGDGADASLAHERAHAVAQHVDVVRGGLALDARHHEHAAGAGDGLALGHERGHARLGERAVVLAHEDEVEAAGTGRLADLGQIVTAVVGPARVHVADAAQDHAAFFLPNARARAR